jgi:hypothetical protein
VQDALVAPLRDPMHALTLIAAPRALRTDMPSRVDRSLAPPGQAGPLPEATVQVVLRTRTFRMLTPHTILKSFHQPDASSVHDSGLQGVTDLLRVLGLPIWLVSNPSLQARLPCCFTQHLCL